MYVPFLKAKQNELLALRTCSNDTYASLIPFFDIPRPKDLTESEVVSSIAKAKSYIEKLVSAREGVFYLDCFDIPPEITIDGNHVYEHTLDEFDDFDFVPVIGTDREVDHINAVLSRSADFTVVAIRLLADEIQTPTMAVSEIKALMKQFGPDMSFDLAFDLRLVRDLPTNTAKNIVKIVETFASDEKIENFIITGSIIPPVITEICRPEESHTHIKSEVRLFQQASASMSDEALERLWYGDYTSVSPDYSDSDIPPQLMRTVQAPKIIYSHEDKLYITRGGSLQLKGDNQYFDLARLVVTSGLWRKKSFSDADKYIYDVSERIPPKCGNASKWINITVCAHLEFYAHFDIAEKGSRLKRA
ncbi:hypothetical protein P7233_18845 [Vibrio parahaemolyticus]|nr:hypothetical protein [Vibrio parahaemolyticus]MDG3038552.1 hypothetical protein [Vibrio parahaemolyticus]